MTHQERPPHVPEGAPHMVYFPSGYKDVYILSTVAIILRNMGNIALVRRALGEPQEGGKLALPGGYMQLNETSRQAILKEVHEETGYEVVEDTLHRFAYMDGPPTLPGRQNEHHQNFVSVFTGQAGAKTGTHDKEVTEVLWVPKADIASLNPAEIGFGHFDILGMYLRHQADPFPSLPITPSDMQPSELFPPGWRQDNPSL